jgi:hypothetical protein
VEVVETVPLVLLVEPAVPDVSVDMVDIVSVDMVDMVSVDMVDIVSVVEYSVLLVSVVPAVIAVSVVASMLVVSSFLQATNTTSVSAVKSTRSFLAILMLLCLVFIFQLVSRKACSVGAELTSSALLLAVKPQPWSSVGIRAIGGSNSGARKTKSPAEAGLSNTTETEN